MKRQHLLLVIIFSAIATVSPVLGQDSSRKDSVMMDSFARTPNGDLRARLDYFLASMMNQTDALGLIYIVGTPAEIAARTRLVQNHMLFRGFDGARVSFRNGRNVGSFRTDLWIIPAGAAPPEIKPEAWIYGEFGRVYRQDAIKRFERFVEELIERRDHQGSMINYGTPPEIALRERWISDSIRYRGIDPLRLTIVNGGTGPVRTVMWLVPPGAENPKP